jgi:hypothetical protein
MNQANLFDNLPDPEPHEIYKPMQPKYRGLYAAEPGTGPKSQTCATCWHITFERVGARKAVPKCALTKPLWNDPGPSEILPNAPACYRWEKGVIL